MGRLEGQGDANGSVRANEHDLSGLQTSLQSDVWRLQCGRSEV